MPKKKNATTWIFAHSPGILTRDPKDPKTPINRTWVVNSRFHENQANFNRTKKAFFSQLSLWLSYLPFIPTDFSHHSECFTECAIFNPLLLQWLYCYYTLSCWISFAHLTKIIKTMHHIAFHYWTFIQWHRYTGELNCTKTVYLLQTWMYHLAMLHVHKYVFF